MRNGLRRFLRWISHYGAAPTLELALPRLPKAKPRQVVAVGDERDRLLAHSEPWLRCFLLLCSDLALRFAEARRAAPCYFDPTHKTITLPVKGGHLHTLPVTEELQGLFAITAAKTCDTTPYVELLSARKLPDADIYRAWTKLKARAGVNPHLRFHDLRRSTATALYHFTKDLRAVQQLLGHAHLATTTQYIAPHDPENLRPLLEALKMPTKVKQ